MYVVACILGTQDFRSVYPYTGSQLNIFFSLREDFRLRLVCKDFEQGTVKDYGARGMVRNLPNPGTQEEILEAGIAQVTQRDSVLKKKIPWRWIECIFVTV